jgi:hypothetical protein
MEVGPGSSCRVLALQKIEGSSPFIHSSEPAGNGGMPRACEGQCQGLPLCVARFGYTPASIVRTQGRRIAPLAARYARGLERERTASANGADDSIDRSATDNRVVSVFK